MASNPITVDPLTWNAQIVNQDGSPTAYFIRQWELMKRFNTALNGTLLPNGVPAGAYGPKGADVKIPYFAVAANGSVTDAGETDLTTILDGAFSSVRGSVLYRGAAAWAALGPGTSGQALVTQGAGADPHWATVSGGGGGGTTPAIVQSVFVRSDTGTASLATAPTAGHYMLFLGVGAANPFITIPQAPWQTIYESYPSLGASGNATPVPYQFACAMIYQVQAGDTGVYTWTHGDEGNVAIFELDTLGQIEAFSVSVPTNGGSTGNVVPTTVLGNALRFLFVQTDGTQQLTPTAITGMSVVHDFYASAGGNNHIGVLMLLTPAFRGNVKVTAGSALSYTNALICNVCG